MRAAWSQLGQWQGFWLRWAERAGAVVRGKGALRGGWKPQGSTAEKRQYHGRIALRMNSVTSSEEPSYIPRSDGKSTECNRNGRRPVKSARARGTTKASGLGSPSDVQPTSIPPLLGGSSPVLHVNLLPFLLSLPPTRQPFSPLLLPIEYSILVPISYSSPCLPLQR